MSSLLILKIQNTGNYSKSKTISVPESQPFIAEMHLTGDLIPVNTGWASAHQLLTVKVGMLCKMFF